MSTATIVIGLINVLTSLVIVAAYLPCLQIIGFDPTLKSGSCFRFMFHMGVSDLFCVAIQLLFGFLNATGLYEHFPEWLNCSISALNHCTWFSTSSFIFLLAFNRWSVITKNFVSLFSQSSTTWFIMIAWFYSWFLWLVILPITSVNFCYFPSTYSFYYDANATHFKLVKDLDWLHGEFVLWGSAICYIWAFIKARSERRAVGPTPEDLDYSLRQNELLLLKQGACIFIYCWLFSQYWHLGPFLYNWGFEYTFAFGNWLWICNAAVNPVVYLGMNKTIRDKVRAKIISLYKKQPKAELNTMTKRKRYEHRSGVVEVDDLVVEDCM